jgi:hypothetical protein
MDDEQDERLARAFVRVRASMVNELREVPYEEPLMPWPEVVGRLWLAARMREAWSLVNAAQRAIVEGDAIVALDKLEDAANRILTGQHELDELRSNMLVSGAQ